tara:strand:+ start:100 stop:771 length:672 start_codon:yes stop_codon:yes gene_type:complete
MKNILFLIFLSTFICGQVVGLKESDDVIDDIDKFVSSNVGKIVSMQYYPIQDNINQGPFGGGGDSFNVQVIKAKSGDAEDIFVHFWTKDKRSSGGYTYTDYYSTGIDYKDFNDVKKAMDTLIKDYNRDKSSIDKMKRDGYKVNNFFATSDGGFTIGYSNRSSNLRRSLKSDNAVTANTNLSNYSLKWYIEIEDHSLDTDLISLGRLLNTIGNFIDDLTYLMGD